MKIYSFLILIFYISFQNGNIISVNLYPDEINAFIQNLQEIGMNTSSKT